MFRCFRITNTFPLSKSNYKSYIHAVSTFSNAPSQTPFIDSLPGSFDFCQEANVRLATDEINFLNEQYEIAKQFDSQSPMFKFNALGTPSVILFSHVLVHQWQQHELQGKTKRLLPPHWIKLVGRITERMYGPQHSVWRSKVAKSFKPNTVDQYTPFIQKAA